MKIWNRRKIKYFLLKFFNKLLAYYNSRPSNSPSPQMFGYSYLSLGKVRLWSLFPLHSVSDGRSSSTPADGGAPLQGKQLLWCARRCTDAAGALSVLSHSSATERTHRTLHLFTDSLRPQYPNLSERKDLFVTSILCLPWKLKNKQTKRHGSSLVTCQSLT